MNEAKTEQTKTAKILYRSSRYGTWQPASIQVPIDEKDVREYCIEDLKGMSIKVAEITIEKVVTP
jgi:hypothetical protein